MLAVVLYRLFLHPLAKYPGPRFAAITDWYSVYHCWIGDRHIDLYRLHLKHGQFDHPNAAQQSVNFNEPQAYTIQARSYA